MGSLAHRLVSSDELRRRLERLDGLPMRASTARLVLRERTDDLSDQDEPPLLVSDLPAPAELDPGWVVERLRGDAPREVFAWIADRDWWPAATGSAAEAIVRLWRHSVAVSLAVRRLAREAGDRDPEQLARVGFLHGLGRWAMAAVDADWLARWMAEPDPRRRLEYERRDLGMELATLSRILAERWACDPLLVEAAWLHGEHDGGLARITVAPERLRLIQEGFAIAERTPWALFPKAPSPTAGDPRLRLLIAEVQVKCASPFVEPDATLHEERLSRSHARLRLRLGQLQAERASCDRFLRTLAESEPSERPATWAERAGRAWCDERGVAAARVEWTGPTGRGRGELPEKTSSSTPADRAPSRVLPLGPHGRSCAEVQLWGEHVAHLDPRALPAWGAWNVWASLIAERARLEERLESVARVHRDHLENAEVLLRQEKLEALAEFAAGAGHELNNPLAVIVGRAQLLLAQEKDPAAVRSLRAILGQAQRAHRILRDLIYVARTPEPRPRFCQPDEIVRHCVRDFKAEAEARGVRLNTLAMEGAPKVWADHDALRHILDSLVRNALEATPKGGRIQVAAWGDSGELCWSVRDNGRGISATEGRHLFDPFYCGRQAGRGLGLGLSRTARIVEQAGGSLRWHSAPGQGSLFQVRLPLANPPEPPRTTAETAPTPLPRGS